MPGAGEVQSDPRRRVRFALLLLPIAGSVLAASLAGTGPASAIGIGSLLLGGAAWLLAVRLARSGGGALPIVVAGAILLRAIAGTVGEPRSDDAYRYLWEGEIVLEGRSPYAVAPASAESSSGADVASRVRTRFPELWARVNHKHVPAAYPPGAQFIGAAAAATCRALELEPERGGIRLLRWFFGACDLLLIWPLVRLLDRARLPRATAVVWAWSPLATIVFAGSAHLDSLAILLLIAALASSSRFRSLALLTAGILVKYLPVVALPWLARGRWAGWRIAAVLACVALAFAPFLLAGPASAIFTGVGEYAFRWEAASLVHRFLEGFFGRFYERDEGLLDPRRLARAVEGLAWLVLAVVHVRRDRDPVRGCAALVGAWLVLSPTLHPWYLCWMLPFLALRPSLAWTWLLAAAPLLDAPYSRWVEEGVWREPAWLWPVVALPFFALWLREHVSFSGGRSGAVRTTP